MVPAEGNLDPKRRQERGYFLRCHCYIELNPVRASMVSHPRAYRWSSYPANAELAYSRLLTPHGEYLALGHNDNERAAAYQELFRAELDSAQLHEIRSAANGGFALGNDRFKAQVAAMLQRRVERGAPGRPQKEEPKTGIQTG